MKGKLAKCVLVTLLIACAPEPTDPAKTSLAGTWQSGGRLFGLSNIRMTIVQEPQGIVSGKWSATGVEPPILCDVGQVCSGDLIGLNLVAHVNISLLNVGTFEGNLVEPGRLRGVFNAPSGSYDTLTFVRTGN